MHALEDGDGICEYPAVGTVVLVSLDRDSFVSYLPGGKLLTTRGVRYLRDLHEHCARLAVHSQQVADILVRVLRLEPLAARSVEATISGTDGTVRAWTGPRFAVVTSAPAN